ncbi:MAG TPA: MMPL family transporter, partial [Micromonosporaceae bacterium]|nr:MMPL family transporter [Micromonosporaceae bacterium]
MTVRIARWSAEHPWRAIAMWIVFVAVCFFGGTAAGLNEATDDDQSIGEAGRAGAIVRSGDFTDPAMENVIITARSGQLDPAAARAAATDAADRLKSLPDVAEVGEPVPARDGSALLLPVTMDGDAETASDRVQPLLDATAAVQADHPQVRVEQVGGPSIGSALDDTIGSDFKRAEFLSLPVTLAILIVAFGALIAAGVPVLLALSSVAAAIGLSTLASYLFPSVEATASVILLIGMAVGVDYSLFYIRREREERAKGRSHLDAVEVAAETSGHAVVVSGAAVIISMAGLFLASDVVFSSFAAGSMLVVAVTVLGSLTVLPALLAKLGRWVDRPRVPVLWRLSTRRTGPDGQPLPPRFWPAVLRPALRYPLVTLVVSVGLLLALAAPALGMKLKFPGPEDLPRDTAVMQAYDRMTAAFPSEGTTHEVAVRVPAGQTEAVRAALTDLAERAAADPLFARIEANGPDIEISPTGRVATLQVATPYASRSDEAKRSLEVLRTDLVPTSLGPVTGAEHAVG